MKFYTVNSLIEFLKEKEFDFKKLILIINSRSYHKNVYNQKQTTPCIIKLIGGKEDKVLFFEDMCKLMEDTTYELTIPIPDRLKTEYIACTIENDPQQSDQFEATYYPRTFGPCGPVTTNKARSEMKKINEAFRISDQEIEI